MTTRPPNIARTQIDPAKEFGGGTAVDDVKLAPGLRIEQYELIRELGRGGMGQVFLARDTRLGRRVAMKFLVSSSPKFTQRFLVEARATARCSHEHIVVIHDVDAYAGLPYMVLEYVEGTSLAKMVTDKRVPMARAIELVVPVVKALVRAHEANIVHRDLKPENIIVTASGTVKVLDFGIAKLFDEDEASAPRRRLPTPTPADATPIAIVGTLPYMSPEQLGADDVDHRTDLWAIGILLYELVAGKHPLEPLTQGKLFGAAAALDEPMPSIANDVAGLPDRLVAIVAKCLAKHKEERYSTAAELLADLEPLLPSRPGRNLVADESPYPGLNAFQEADANRFFGRSQDIAGAVARLREHPFVGVIGPSGVGKSSFVRAGVVPALKASGDAWEILIVRPGRQPLAALAGALEGLRDSRDSDPTLGDGARDPMQRLREEPGVFGARLRARARRKRTQILLFIDQHEELYTLVPDLEERRAFTACLAGAADDPSGPLRVMVAMRTDFLDHAAEDRRFVDELARALVFLQPPNRAGLEEALTQPLEVLGYGFEPGIVPSMLETLEATPGPLPLLQFTAAKLWENRDRSRRVLTRAAYDAMGGVAGALATHADEVLAGFSAADQKLVRAVFQRLVTPERTRAIVDAEDLRELAPDVERILAMLVAARLIVVHTAVELVHESLIKSWPTLQRWLDESQEDAAFISQLRAASKQWDGRGRADGLLWRNEAMEEARLWRTRYRGELPVREQAFLDAAFALASRAARNTRRFVVGAFVFLIGLVIIGGVLLVQIRNAEQFANDKADALSRSIKDRDEKEARAKAAEEIAKQSVDAKQHAEADKAKADDDRLAAEAVARSEAAKRQQLAGEKAVVEKGKQIAETKAATEAAKAAALEKTKKATDAVTDKRKSKISTGGLK